MKKSNRFMPLIMAVCVIIGIMIGSFYANHFSGNRLNIINSGSNRLSNLLHLIDDQYVDKVNIDSLVDVAIPQILADLDPHSVYISAKDAQAVADDLKGSFSGSGYRVHHTQGHNTRAERREERSGTACWHPRRRQDSKRGRQAVRGQDCHERGGHATPERPEGHEGEIRCDALRTKSREILYGNAWRHTAEEHYSHVYARQEHRIY